MKIFNACSVALLAFGLLTPACATDSPAPTGPASARVAAGATAHAQLGVEEYGVRLNPAEGNLAVELRGAGGAVLAEVTSFRQPSGAGVFRVDAGGVVTDVIADGDALTIARDGTVRYTLDRSAVEAAGGLAELEASAQALPADVVDAIRIAGVVVTDQALVDYVTTESPASVAYLIPDCPWWVTLAACAGWGTGVGTIMCVACGASWLL
jgi:hypothetical protein